MRRKTVVQLLGNHLHLLIEIVFTLALVDIFLNSLIDLILNLHQVALVGKHTAYLFKPLERIYLVEYLLTLLVFKHNIRSDIIGKLARIVLFKHVENDLGRHLRNDLSVIFKIVLGLTDERSRIVLVVGTDHRLTAYLHIGDEIRLALEHIDKRRS